MCIQTDNGFELTNRFVNGKSNLFENTLKSLNIEHKLIRHFCLDTMGKVEPFHRKDNDVLCFEKIVFV